MIEPANQQVNDAIAILRGLKPCNLCKAKRILTVVRQIAKRVYHLKLLCRECGGKGWYKPTDMASLSDMFGREDYIDPDIE